MAVRPITITFTNYTPAALSFCSETTTSGTTPVLSGLPVGPGGTASMTAQASGAEGPSGTVNLTGAGGTYSFTYDHPVGPGRSTVTWSTPSGTEVLFLVDELCHHDAYAVYEITT